MTGAQHLLDDRAMAAFIIRGYHTIDLDLPEDFHSSLYHQIETVFEKEGNPGNNILPRIPDIRKVLDHPRTTGALASILGPDYYVHPHRHCHFNPPGSEGQHLHKDSWSRHRHHTRWLMAFYYPQDTPAERGPTGIVPTSQYHNASPDAQVGRLIPLSGRAGTLSIVHYDLWHKAMPNTTAHKRFMVKFLFARMQEPTAPTWHSTTATWPGRDETRAPLWRHLWRWHRGQSGPAAVTLDIEDQIARLRGDDETAALTAAYTLAAAGSAAVPPLIEALRAPSPTLRRHAGHALAARGKTAVPALAALLAETSLSDPTRASALDTLGDIGLEAGESAALVAQNLRHASIPVRRCAAEALGTLGPAATPTSPSLAQALGDADDWVRRHAALSLARLGPKAAEATPALIQALEDPNRYVRAKSALALQRIATPESQEALLHFLFTARWCPLTTSESAY